VDYQPDGGRFIIIIIRIRYKRYDIFFSFIYHTDRRIYRYIIIIIIVIIGRAYIQYKYIYKRYSYIHIDKLYVLYTYDVHVSFR